MIIVVVQEFYVFTVAIVDINFVLQGYLLPQGVYISSVTIVKSDLADKFYTPMAVNVIDA